MINESKLASTSIKPLIISFYTLKTPYEQEVANLIRSCTDWGLDYCIEGKESQGSWEKNCGLKPHFILEKLEELKRPVLWVDADAVFLKKPDFTLFEGYDFSVRIFEGLPRSNPSKVMSGTIYVNYTPAGMDLVRRWGKNCKRRLQKDGRVWDQHVLRELVLREQAARARSRPIEDELAELSNAGDAEQSRLTYRRNSRPKARVLQKKANIFPLPVSYCKIYDLDILFVDQADVVIEHYQASRRFKDVVC